jgi:hypothetical protein
MVWPTLHGEASEARAWRVGLKIAVRKVRGFYPGGAPVRTPGLLTHPFRSTDERKIMNRIRFLTVLASAAAAPLMVSCQNGTGGMFLDPTLQRRF